MSPLIGGDGAARGPCRATRRSSRPAPRTMAASLRLRGDEPRVGILLVRVRGVLRRHHGLLDLGARKAFAARRERLDIGFAERDAALPAVDAEDLRTRRRARAGRRKRSRRSGPCAPVRAASAVMSLAVATMNTRARCSASQVRKAPSTRREVPLSPSPVDRAFSISSSHNTQGASASAEVSESRRFFSDSPCHLEYSAPKSRRTSGTPSTPAAARAARLLPQPCTPNNNTPLGASSPGRAAVECGLALQDPAAQVLHPADLGEARGIRLERQRAAAVQQLILRREQRLDVVLGERAVVEDGLARQPLHVVQRQSGEVVDQLRHRLHVDARHPAVQLCPFAGHAHDDGVPFLLVRQRHAEARRQVFELLRQLHLEADEHDGARAFRRIPARCP